MTEQELTDLVLEKIAGAPDPRFRVVMLSLVKHLHGFIREVGLTQEEWRKGGHGGRSELCHVWTYMDPARLQRCSAC